VVVGRQREHPEAEHDKEHPGDGSVMPRQRGVGGEGQKGQEHRKGQVNGPGLGLRDDEKAQPVAEGRRDPDLKQGPGHRGGVDQSAGEGARIPGAHFHGCGQLRRSGAPGPPATEAGVSFRSVMEAGSADRRRQSFSRPASR
jgi:hypothetical protein